MNERDKTSEFKGYKLHKLDSGPSSEVALNKTDAIHYYKQVKMPSNS